MNPAKNHDHENKESIFSIQELVNQKIKPLSGQGAVLEVQSEDRDAMCFCSNGVLYRTKEAKESTVRFYETRIRNYAKENGHAFTLKKVVTIKTNEIESLYKQLQVEQDHEQTTEAHLFAQKIIEWCSEQRGSDLHFTTNGNYGGMVQIRVDGDLYPVTIQDDTFQIAKFDSERMYGGLFHFKSELINHACRVIYSSFTNDNADTHYKENERQAAQITDNLPHYVDSLRVASTPVNKGETFVVRFLYKPNKAVQDLEGIGLSEEAIKRIRFLLNFPFGLVLVSGPTGSGKSTLLQSTIYEKFINSKGKSNICTLEDPAEYELPGKQLSLIINDKVENNYDKQVSAALKQILRLDPDFILYGEVRDQQAAKHAISSALTGHQVWGSIHANTALAILTRLKDMGISNALLNDPDIVRGFVSTRLVKRLCPCCKKEFDAMNSDSDRKLFTAIETISEKKLNKQISIDNHPILMKGDGCDKCNHTGFSGRLPVAEVIICDDAFFEKFAQVETNRSELIDYVYNEQKTTSLIADTITKVLEGEVDPWQAQKVVGQFELEQIMEDHKIQSNEVHHMSYQGET